MAKLEGNEDKKGKQKEAKKDEEIEEESRGCRELKKSVAGSLPSLAAASLSRHNKLAPW